MQLLLVAKISELRMLMARWPKMVNTRVVRQLPVKTETTEAPPFFMSNRLATQISTEMFRIKTSKTPIAPKVSVRRQLFGFEVKGLDAVDS